MGNNGIDHTCLQQLASSEPVMKYEERHAVYHHPAFFETGIPQSL